MRLSFSALVVLTAAMFASPLGAAEPDKPFNGKDLAGWKFVGPAEKSNWRAGVARVSPDNPKLLVVDPGEGDLVNALPTGKHGESVDVYSDYTHGDAVIDLEVMVPEGSNSGVYVHGEYEIQVLDSFGKDAKPGLGDMGAVYGAKPPTNPPTASRASGARCTSSSARRGSTPPERRRPTPGW